MTERDTADEPGIDSDPSDDSVEPGRSYRQGATPTDADTRRASETRAERAASAERSPTEPVPWRAGAVDSPATDRSAPSVSLDVGSAEVGGRFEVSVSAQGVEAVVVEDLWTEWNVYSVDDDGASFVDETADSGRCGFEYESVQSEASPSVTLLMPDNYVGGEYAITCRARADGTDSIATASDVLTVTESSYETHDDWYYDFDDPEVNHATSKHFQIIWGPDDSEVDETFVAGNLELLERLWELYVDELGFTAPSTRWDGSDEERYKVNVYLFYTGLPHPHHDKGGAVQGDRDKYAYISARPSWMRVDPPNWTLPHEFGHVVHSHQNQVWRDALNGLGPWWESVANWFREQFLTSDHYQYGTTEYGPDTGFYRPFLEHSHSFQLHGRNYYHGWPLLQFLYENPDDLDGYGEGFILSLLNDSTAGQNFYEMVDTLAPDADLKETLGHWAKRMATGDFEYRDLYREEMEYLDRNRPARYRVFTELEPVPDRAGWWRVPFEHAPMQGGCTLVELTPDGGTVTVEFDGVGGRDDADWRLALVALADDGTTRYSAVVNDEASLDVAADEDCYLAVVATPDEMLGVDAFANEDEQPYDGYRGKAKLPYEVRFSGATPVRTTTDPPDREGSRHPNGGGFVADSATVASSAYVGPNALVLDEATVDGDAQVRDYAVVQDSATVTDDARVLEHARVSDQTTVRDQAVVKGSAFTFESGVLEGTVVVDGDYAGGLSLDGATVFGWLPKEEVATDRPTHPDVHTEYTFDEAGHGLAIDTYGVNHGVLRNDPDASDGFLSLDGTDQHVVLPDHVLDYRDRAVTTEVRPAGDAAGRVWALGQDASERMCLLVEDDDTLTFRVDSGGDSWTVETDATLPADEWTTVRVETGEGGTSVAVDGSVVASDDSLTVRPVDLRTDDPLAEPHANYLGRGVSDSTARFEGDVRLFRVGTVA